ncbi:hypothetical protein M427DRAFT_155281 [Gonapodya prolifera JEL478]|uniref:Reverse transcriptase domain-containing protein n=1 Tax=Gonapodya prolifera (strain JEL478) TaxID=1344416 RepID=A0A139AFG4_GONPJ|nr:hypothetical protein M427DRAFT_155281 [Gonapodya prolifera JEL478]|eukprot:KXS15572.1 hypothetical protein M427DRAFT_155281 [Gonapodya prolifera JEL478]
MVSFSKIRAVAAIKLQELQRQRERLNKHYDEAIAEAEKQTTLPKKLFALYTGIKTATFAETPLHPGIANLDNLVDRATWDPTVTEGVLTGWIEKMKEEITRGRKRAEFAWLFGKILTEWFSVNSDDESARENPEDEDEEFEDLAPNPERDAFVERLTRLAVPVAEGEYDLSVVDDIFADFETGVLEELQDAIQTYAKAGITSKLRTPEVRAAISSILRDNLVDHRGRGALKDILASDALCNEYCGCVAIVMDNIEEWNWPGSGEGEKGMTMRVRRNRSFKWRPFVDEDVLTAIVLQVIGVRWSVTLRKALTTYWNKLIKHVVSDQTNYISWNTVFQSRANARTAVFCCSLPASIEMQESASAYGNKAGSVGKTKGERTKKEKLLDLVATEVGLTKWVAAPKMANTVVGLDIKDFYLSIPHPLILKLLDKVGMPSKWLSFFTRFLTPRVILGVPPDAQPRTIQRGVLLAHALSRLASELVLFGLDVAVIKETKGNVQVTRVVDDIFLWHHQPIVLGAAYSATEKYLKRCGLAINKDKSGSVVIPGGEFPPNTPVPAPSEHYPQGLVRWGFLRLESSGSWVVDDTLLSATITQLNGELAKSRSVLSAVNVFNSFTRYLDKMVATPSTALGLGHVEGVLRAQGRLRGEAGGAGGFLKYLEKRITEGFLKGDKLGALLEREGIPEAWFFWPITAGGLAVSNPCVSLTAYRSRLLTLAKDKVVQTYEQSVAIVRGDITVPTTKSKPVADSDDEDGDDDEDDENVDYDEVDAEPPKPSATKNALPSDEIAVKEIKGWKPFPWETQNNMIGQTYIFHTTRKIEPADPEQTNQHKALVAEFVNRGTEVKQKKQASLGNYYQWVLASYSQQILDQFGSLGFASAQLIPVALIMHLRSESPEAE